RRVAVNRGNQSQSSGGNQVIEVDALGQSFVNAPGDQTDLRQMLENQAFALFGRVIPVLVLLETTGRLFYCDLSLHAATVPNFARPTGLHLRIKSRITSSVAGSRSSGMRWPRE